MSEIDQLYKRIEELNNELGEEIRQNSAMRRVIDAVKGCKEEWIDLDDHIEDGKKCLCEKCILIRLYDEYERLKDFPIWKDGKPEINILLDENGKPDLKPLDDFISAQKKALDEYEKEMKG